MRNTHLCYILLLTIIAAVGWYRNEQQTRLEQQVYNPELGVQALEGEIRTLLEEIERSATMYRNTRTTLYTNLAMEADTLVRKNLAKISSSEPSEYLSLVDTLKYHLGQLAEDDPTVIRQLNALLPSDPDHILCPVNLLQQQTGIEKIRIRQLFQTQCVMALRTVLNFYAEKTAHTGTCFDCGINQPTLICDRLFPAVGDTLRHTVVLAGFNYDIQVKYILVNGDTLPNVIDELGQFEHVYPAPGVYPLSVTVVYSKKPFSNIFQTTTKDFWVRVR